jgi:PAS domain S-box-containing protein
LLVVFFCKMPSKFLSTAIQNSLGVIVFSLDQNYCYTSFSISHQQTMKRIWGVDITIGMNMLEILSISRPEDSMKAKANFDRALAGEHFRKIEEYGDEHFQRTFWENRYDPIYDDSKKEVIGLVVFVINISDRSLLIESIMGEGERFNLAIKAARIGIWEWNMLTNEVYWSDEILALYNLDDSFRHLSFQKYFEFVHPDDIAHLNASITSAIESKGKYFTQHRVTPPDGKMRWIEGIGKIILESDKPVKMIGTVIDITEQKKLESESKEAYSLLQAAIEATADGILVVDINGKISAYNDKFLSIYGFSKEEAYNQPDEILLQKAITKVLKPERFLAKIKELYANPEAESNDFIQLTNGTILHRYSKPQRLGGKVVGRVWSFRDITEQKRAEETIIKSEENYRTLNNNMLDLVSQVDIKGNFIYLSPSHKTILGYVNPQDRIGKSMFGSAHPDDLPLIRQKYQEVLATKKSAKLEFRYKKVDGTYIWLESTGNPILSDDGEVETLVISSRDVSDRKNTEEDLKHRDALVSALAKAISELAIAAEVWGGLQKGIGILGEAAHLDRIYVFQNESVGDGIVANQRISWESDPLISQKNNPKLHRLEYVIAPSVLQALLHHKAFISHVGDIKDNAFRHLLEAQGTQSVTLAPIYLKNHFWGFIGFEECKTSRDITSAEFFTLKSFTSTLQAILEKKQIEDESTDWKKRYELVSNSSGQVVYDYYLPSGKIIWSENILSELGYAQEEIGTVESWGEKIHPEDRAEAFDKLDKAENALTKYEVTYRFQVKNGDYLHMSDRGFFLSNKNGKAYRMLGAMSDVTQQREAEIALKESDSRFRTLQEASFGGIGLHYEGEILDANKGLSDITGFSYEELLGMNGLNLIAPESLDIVREKINTGYEKPYDVIGVRKNGTRYNLEIHGRNLPYKGKIIRVTEFRDITERKQSEEKIVEQNNKLSLIAEDLKRKNDQLEEFTQIVSHNLRSPVSNILTLLDFYEKSNDEAERATFMKMLKDSGAKILTNLHELNEVLKIKQDKDIERQDLNFESVFGSIRNLLSAKITEAEATILTDFARAPKVNYPNIYLESIFVNLLTNALKYAHPDRKPEISFVTEMDNGQVILKVGDNGSGIDLKRYGHQIFKLRKTFHKHPESRGIGLFMIKSQIEAMGGDISISSEENIGTTFIVKL